MRTLHPKNPGRLCSAMAMLLLGACVSSSVGTPTSSVAHPMLQVAVAPDGGEIIDAVVASIRESGTYSGKVLSREESRSLLKSLGLSSLIAVQPENLAKLATSNVDGWLTAEADTSAITEKPTTVFLRILSTRNPGQLIQLSWKNGKGGMPGSPADMMMKKDAKEAGTEIGTAIASALAATLQGSSPVVE